MNRIIKLLLEFRAYINRLIKPSGSYWTANNNIKPLSTKFGFDRGKPIDRFWIEDFLSKNKRNIKGVCLEITDNYYTKKFGGHKVTKSDVLDIDKENKLATVVGDLRNLKNIVREGQYDCILLTHVLGLIDNLDMAVSEVYRILKPGGSVLITSSCFSPDYGNNKNFWRFTQEGMKYLLGKYFKSSKIEVDTYGNVLAGQFFWVGMAQEDVSTDVLEYKDNRYPCIVVARATK